MPAYSGNAPIDRCIGNVIEHGDLSEPLRLTR
jgi:hypothetical protein